MNLRKIKPAPNNYFLRYGVALFSVIFILFITLGISLVVNRPLAAPLFLVAILFSAWWGGIRPAFLTTIVSGIFIDYFFITPVYDLTLSLDEILRFFLFVIEGCLLSWLLTSRMQIMDEISDSREQLRSLSLHQQVLREEERKRISLEIHDELGQSLTGLKMEVHFLNKKINEHNKVSESIHISENIEEMQRTIDFTISSVRRIATELRPPVIDDLGLVAAIEWQSKEFQRRTGILCKLETDLENVDIDSESAIAVFRIFQESLTNIIRHAEATSVKVILKKTDKTINLDIKDNGKGINEKDLKNKKSLGLLGMKERARSINGDLKVNGGEIDGTRIQLEFPLLNDSLLN